MDIPINVDVLCAGELCGRSTSLVVNPVSERVTHLVVTEKTFPNIERMVPIDEIIESTPNSILLRCNRTGLSNMEAFEETDFIDSDRLETKLPYDVPFQVWPYGMYGAIPVHLEHERIPAGEIAIHRGTAVVAAADEQVGKVDEFLVDPEDDVITHLVLREGHLWGKRDITIPISEIKKIAEDAVYLKLDKEALEKLPAIPVKRRWK